MQFKLFLFVTALIIFTFTVSYSIFLVPYIFSTNIPLKSNTVIQTNSQSHTLKPIASNQWYSSMYNSFPTSPMYALPLAYRLSNNGIEISYPVISRSADEIVAPFNEDISINTGSKLQNTRITSIGDWHIDASMFDADGNRLVATMGHGMPYMILKSSSNTLNIQLKKDFVVMNGTGKIANNSQFTSNTIEIENKSSKYILLLPEESEITYRNNTLSLQNVNRLVVGVLDDNENIALFNELRNIDITDTQTYPTVQQDKLNIQYNIATKNDATPLIALYPHQYDNLQGKQEKLGEYRSIRGPLYLYKTSTFTTTTPLIVPKTSYQPIKGNNEALKTQIQKDIEEIIEKGSPSDSVYFQGTWFGKVGSLILLADSQGLQQEKQELIQYIKPIFLKSLNEFRYEEEKTSLLANKSEFGNDQLNDHHFHYGYYIRLAAIIGSIELDFVDKTDNVIDEMVKDIATINRQDNKYPFLRNFDIYESHSWADGYGASPMGNNQESSSEAINAWYSLYLWSQVTRDTNLNQYSLYLYNSEIQGTKYYWFDIKDLYGAPYSHAIASQVWGGKVSFTTWFSGETNMKYGIQLLPLTPGSEYLGTFEDFTKYENDFTKSNGSVSDEWGDLFVAWKSFYNNEEALQESPLINKMEGNNSKSNLLYHLYKNSE